VQGTDTRSFRARFLEKKTKLVQLILMLKTLLRCRWEPRMSVISLTNGGGCCLGEREGSQQHPRQLGICRALEKCPGRCRSYESMKCPAFKRVINRAYVKAVELDLQKGSLSCRNQDVSPSIPLSPVRWGLHKCHRHCSGGRQAE